MKLYLSWLQSDNPYKQKWNLQYVDITVHSFKHDVWSHLGVIRLNLIRPKAKPINVHSN